MGRPCFLWRNVSFLRMNLDGAVPICLLWFPWRRVLYEERHAENMLLGPWKSRMYKLYFTSQKSQLVWAWQHAIRMPSSQPNLWCYRKLCHLSSENDLNQSINKQAALYFWNSERENVRPHTHTHTHTHPSVCELSITVVACFVLLWLSIIYPMNWSDLL